MFVNQGGSQNELNLTTLDKEQKMKAKPKSTTVETTQVDTPPVVNPDASAHATPKKPLDPKMALDAGLSMAVKAYVGLKREVIEANKIRERARTIMLRMGAELPNDGVDDNDMVVAVKKVGRPATKNTSSSSSSVSKTLWDVVENHLFSGGFIAPKFENSSVIKTLAEKAGYSTAANLLSQKSRNGELIKGDRGQYALPKGYKRK